MELKQEAKESLNLIREKVLSNTKLDKVEKIHLSVVYESITGKILSLNCEGCLQVAFKILQNYIKLYEPLELKPIEAVINEVKDIFHTVKGLRNKLKALKVPIPNNASKEELIRLLNENQNGKI